MPTRSFTSSKDTQFGDCYFDICQTEKLLVRETSKTYERTGIYLFLIFFKKAAKDYKFERRVLLTIDEFENLVKKQEKYAKLQRKIPQQNHSQQTSKSLINVIATV